MGRYERYKEDTITWLTWLIQTAVDHGSRVDTLGRLKGKERKQAKEAGLGKGKGAASIKVKNLAPGRFEISTEEILQAAEYLAALDIKFTMPQNVHRSYKSALAMRIRYNKRYENDPNSDPRSNEGHRWFISIMEDVHEQLRNCVRVQPSSKSKSHPDQSSGSVDTLSNLYEALSMAEAVEEYLQAEDEEASTSAPETSGNVPKIVYEPKISKEEQQRMKAISLCMDAVATHTYITNVWAQVEANQVNPGVAAFNTEAAVEIFGYQEQNLYREDSKLTSELALDMGLNEGSELHLARLTLVDVAKSHKLLGETQLLSIGALNSDGRHPDIIDVSAIDKDRTLIQSLSAIALETKDRAVRIAKPFVDTTFDQLSRTLQGVNTGCLPCFQGVLAAQTILSLQVKHPFDGPAISHLLHLKDILEDLFSEKSLSRFPRVTSFDSFQKLTPIAEWVDYWPTKAAEAYSQWPLPLLGSVDGRFVDGLFLWRTNPVLPGHMYFNTLLLREEIGVELINTVPHAFAMCHLYSALVRTGRVKLKVKANRNIFKTFYELHMQEIFMGYLPPKNAPAMLVRLREAVGTSPRLIKQGQLPLGSSRPVADADKITRQDRWHVKTSPTIHILREYVHGRAQLIQILARFHEKQQERLPKRDRKSFDEIQAKPFLDQLRKEIQESFPRLDFDYCMMHEICTMLLGAIDADIGGPVPLLPERQARPDRDAWAAGTLYAYTMVNQLLRDLEYIEGAPAGALLADEEPARRVGIASDILQSYLDNAEW